jgi:tryptophanyl-tRNA synthetase
MSIQTDSKGLDDPKDPETCHVFQLYKLLASEAMIAEMHAKYTAGGFGYGHAKLALLELILTNYANHRQIYADYMQNPAKIDAVLAVGAEKARKVANGVLARVRTKLGYAAI